MLRLQRHDHPHHCSSQWKGSLTHDLKKLMFISGTGTSLVLNALSHLCTLPSQLTYSDISEKELT